MNIIDISHYQGNINWTEARKHLDLIIMRASVGLNPDIKYASYASECGVPFGTYHYVKAGDAASAKREAEYFYKQATQNGIQPLFFCADIEYEAQTSFTTNTVTEVFATTLRELGAKKIGLYISQSRYPYASRDLYDFIWIPRYGKNTGEADENYKPKYPCDLWQYTSNGHIDGISTRVDMDKLYGDKTLEWFIQGKTVEKKQVAATNTEKFSNTHFANFCRGMVGQRYWYGTQVQRCTKTLYEKKSKQFPSQYTSDRNEQIKKDILEHKLCSDCVGFIIGYFYTNAGEGVLESIGKEEDYFTYKYGSNGFPDKSSSGLFEWAKTKTSGWGTMDTMPDIPGIAVRRDGHVGVYVGNNEIAEASCFANGIILTKLNKSKWLNWYKIPGIKYTNSVVEEQAQNTVINSSSNYTGSVNKNNFVVQDSTPVEEKAANKYELLVTTDANVRTGHSPIYPVLTSLKKGDKVIAVTNDKNEPMIAANGWYAIECTNQIGWISGQAIKNMG